MSIHELFNDNNENYFHSSEYAKAARGSQIGTTNTQSFTERYQADRNRKVVTNRYHDSHVARYNNRAVGEQGGVARPTPGGIKGAPARPAQVPPRPQGFQEPPPRYNPYS